MVNEYSHSVSRNLAILLANLGYPQWDFQSECPQLWVFDLLTNLSDTLSKHIELTNVLAQLIRGRLIEDYPLWTVEEDQAKMKTKIAQKYLGVNKKQLLLSSK